MRSLLQQDVVSNIHSTGARAIGRSGCFDGFVRPG